MQQVIATIIFNFILLSLGLVFWLTTKMLDWIMDWMHLPLHDSTLDPAGWNKSKLTKVRQVQQ